MAKRDPSETFLERLAHLAAQQGVAISDELHQLIVKATDEIAALDKRLTREPPKKPRKKTAKKTEIAVHAKGRTRTKKSSTRRSTAKRPRRKA